MLTPPLWFLNFQTGMWCEREWEYKLRRRSNDLWHMSTRHLFVRCHLSIRPRPSNSRRFSHVDFQWHEEHIGRPSTVIWANKPELNTSPMTPYKTGCLGEVFGESEKYRNGLALGKHTDGRGFWFQLGLDLGGHNLVRLICIKLSKAGREWWIWAINWPIVLLWYTHPHTHHTPLTHSHQHILTRLPYLQNTRPPLLCQTVISTIGLNDRITYSAIHVRGSKKDPESWHWRALIDHNTHGYCVFKAR